MASVQGTPQNPPTLVPEVGSCYSYAWPLMWKNFLELFLVAIVNLILTIPSSAGSWGGGFGLPYFLALAYSFLIGGPLDFGMSFAYLRAARGEKPEVQNLFEPFKNYWNSVLASLLVSVIVLVGFVLLVVPGVIFACKLAFTPYLVVDRKMEAVEAVKESWRMTNGHALDIFLMGLLAIPIVIVGLIALVVGVIPAVMWVTLAFASLYHSVRQTEKAPAQAAV